METGTVLFRCEVALVMFFRGPLLVTATVMSAGVLGVASGWAGPSGSRLMDGWLLSFSGALWLLGGWATPRRSTSSTTVSTQVRLVWADRTHGQGTVILRWHTHLSCSCWCQPWLTIMPRALRMLSLHMGQVQCSFSHGSTHTLWKTCLQETRGVMNEGSSWFYSCKQQNRRGPVFL